MNNNQFIKIENLTEINAKKITLNFTFKEFIYFS